MLHSLTYISVFHSANAVIVFSQFSMSSPPSWSYRNPALNYVIMFSASTPSCSTTVSLATRSDHFSISFTFNFAFNPRDFYTRGYKIIIIIIITVTLYRAFI